MIKLKFVKNIDLQNIPARAKRVLIWLRKISFADIKQSIVNWWSLPTMGSLSNKSLFRLAVKNLRNQPSRTMMTVMAIAMGTAAVVFLVSFAYGLQEIVTKRIVSPNSLRMTDVVSSTTSLSLNDATMDEIKGIDGVEDVAPLISLAGSLSFNESRIDVVILSVGENYYEYASPVLVGGSWMDKSAFEPFTGETGSLSELIGEVAGWSDSSLGEVSLGDRVDEVSHRFKINDDEYIPLREGYSQKSPVLGWVKGSVLQSFSGKLVWGGSYESVDSSGKSYRTSSGDWYGKWMKAEVPLYREITSTVYEPLTDEFGGQVKSEGYLTLNSVRVLSVAEATVQKGVENEIKKMGEVLGEATESALTQIVLSNTDTTASAELVTAAVQQSTDVATAEAELAVTNVKREGGKEIVVTSALLNTFKLETDDILGKNVSLEYILSGGQIQGASGRVLTNPIEYKVVGVIKNDKQVMIFAPIQELQSMGVSKYSLLKVLARDTSDLERVRERIQVMGFTTQSIVDTIAQVDRLFRIMKFLLGAFGVTALIVALFGMFNTLTVSLLERNREVGVMKTLGTVDRDIFRLFLAESFLIGVTGGTLGVLLGSILGVIVNLVSMIWRDDMGVSLFRTPILFALGVLLLSVMVGLVTGLYPSMRAKKISALNALRYE